MAYFKYFEGIPEIVYDKLREEVKRRAMRKLPEEEIVIRSLIPQDLGLATPEWTFNIVTGIWNTLINTTIADETYIGIYGILYSMSDTQAVAQLKIECMESDERYWEVQGCNFSENASFFFDDPVIADQNTNITITGYGVDDVVAEKICFFGVVAEKKGLLVQGNS